MYQLIYLRLEIAEKVNEKKRGEVIKRLFAIRTLDISGQLCGHWLCESNIGQLQIIHLQNFDV